MAHDPTCAATRSARVLMSTWVRESMSDQSAQAVRHGQRTILFVSDKKFGAKYHRNDRRSDLAQLGQTSSTFKASMSPDVATLGLRMMDRSCASSGITCTIFKSRASRMEEQELTMPDFRATDNDVIRQHG